MTSHNLLSRVFLEQKPKTAALLLQSYSPAECFEYLEDMPVEILSPVVGNMGSWPATRLLTMFSSQFSAEVIAGLAETEAEAILRLMTEEQRKAIFSFLPKALARGFERKLVYPESTVGAWMNSAITFFSVDNTVGDCLEIVKQQKSQLEGVLLVVDERRHLVGTAELEQLLVVDNDRLLVELLHQDISPLPASATLWEVADNRGWVEFSTLPVTDHSGVIHGVLTRKSLHAGLQKSYQQKFEVNRFSLLPHLFGAFLVAFTGLLQALSSSPRADAFGNRVIREGGKDER